MEFFTTINSVYVMIGSIALGAMCGMLGVFGVLRKQGLLGDALAHAALPGIAIAFLIMGERILAGLLLGALVSGLLGAFCIQYLVKATKIKMDSAMAAVLSVFFGFGIVLLTFIQRLPSASKAGLDTFLFGQAAALLKIDVILMSSIFLFTLLVVFIFWKELKMFIFDSSFAAVLGFRSRFFEILFMTIYVLAILVSLQAVGVVLTAAMFITPAAAALLWTKRLLSAVVLSVVFGSISSASGAYVSIVAEGMPTGPVIVMAASVIFLFSFMFASRGGIVWKAIERYKYSKKVNLENLLAKLYRDTESGVNKWQRSDISLIMLWRLRSNGYINSGNEITLTKKGLVSGFKVVQKHRLWETYLVERMNFSHDHVHRDAEIMEHLLTDDVVEKINSILGNPKVDPHGKSLKMK
ncbi:hypothetical protein COU74_00905 [Candidatus Peregrinibacteria bacterium CG10_big_fil_rev_8_21_14_0_10_36_19]|nr:MAG: hypothetical protein COU74_00905 [Candidatus Peregrinibacteria bacterium CG10_big_fil_rev_8_21_14_0_10_36_19]